MKLIPVGLSVTRTTATVFLLLTLCASDARAQQGVGRCGTAPTMITGRVVEAQTGRPIGRRGVTLRQGERSVCTALADSTGRFQFHGAAPGEYQLSAGSLGYRAFKPIPVELGDRDTLALSIQLVPGSHFDDCLDAPACAEWLKPLEMPRATDGKQFELAAFRTAAALTWRGLDKPLDHYLCFDAAPDVAAAFRQSYQKYAQRADCVVTPAAGRVRERLRHIETGQDAYALTVTRVRSTGPNSRTADLEFYVAPLWAEGWICTFSKDTRGWRPVECRMRWIS